MPRMSPNSSLSGKVPASVVNENAYSDIETRQTSIGASYPIKTVDEKAERQKLQEKYARLRKERQNQEAELAR